MIPTILFPASSMSPRQPDDAFLTECDAAKEAGFKVAFLGLESFFGAEPSLRGLEDGPGTVMYRGWMLKEDDYRRMEVALTALEKVLVTSTSQYLYSYHFPNWYKDIEEMTPKSTWIPQEDFGPILKLDTILPTMAFNQFGPKSLIVKDYVKSRKHEWFDACFIPGTGVAVNADDSSFKAWDQNFMRVVRNFVERQGEFLVGGLVLREFVNLKRIGIHTKSRLPLVNEHRFFVVDGQVVYQAPYWGEGDYSGRKPTPETIEHALFRLRAPFLSIDVAELEDGGWIIVEIGDGGTSGIPDGGSPLDFYKALRSVYP